MALVKQCLDLPTHNSPDQFGPNMDASEWQRAQGASE